ncbi:hypothetical protein T02_15773 [Trichinella nativa]|uniref:Uncharacterized protein n=2 Tax=Trichinella TaxID=6333 RepID=A0A0V1L8C6_9BILA|nr:hypothetical protein T12_12688 [Trichinella patagoniensis]KRZ55776.1 hypothetical protein T02_15773 [Trichinella nativa]
MKLGLFLTGAQTSRPTPSWGLKNLTIKIDLLMFFNDQCQFDNSIAKQVKLPKKPKIIIFHNYPKGIKPTFDFEIAHYSFQY